MPVLTNVADAVATITLDWPEKRNAMGPVEAGVLADAFDAVGQRADVSCIILTGNGAFSAGGDLPTILEMIDEGREAVAKALYSSFHRVTRSILGVPQPTFAAVDGPAIGLGMDMALACDWRAVGPRGWFFQGWARVGLIPGAGGELILRRIGSGLLWDLLTRTDPVGPEAAENLGFATVATESALSAAQSKAQELLALPDAALRAYVDLNRATIRADLDTHLAQCLEHQVSHLCSEEFGNRARAVLSH